MTAIVMVMMSDEEVASFGRNAEPGFGALRTPRGLLPLVAMDIDARVVGTIAATEVAQTFVNTTGTPIEATYIFPLPDRAAVHRFRMEVGGRVIEGAIDERSKARQGYDEAIARGHRAAIAEEERPGVFTMRVGNLMPNEAATVRISLVGPLPVDDGEVTFQFPLVVAQRYMPGSGLGGDQAGLGTAGDTSLVPDASRISPPVLLPGFANPVRLGLRVAIEDPNLGGVASSLHSVVASKRDAYVVEVLPGERLDRDFILRWRIDPRHELRSQLVCADDADGRGGSFMVTLVPPSTTAVAAKPRDVVFVLDRSGSMEGWKMVAARRAAARMIDTLTSRDRFCVMAFDNAIEFAPDHVLVDATDRNRYRAVEMLAKVESRGGTEMAEPLRRAAQMLAGYDDRERVIVLVTDGQIGNEDHILGELGAQLRNVRVFALGIDQAVNAGFLRRLAALGGGLCELVESEDRLDAVMATMHRRIGTPVATDLHLRSIGLDLDETTLSPRRLPDVFAGAPVAIFGRYRGSAPPHAAIELAASAGGEPLRIRVERQGDPRPATWLGASWARAHIRDLEDQYAAGFKNTWDKQQVEQQIVRTSKHFGVLSRFTAFLAVEGDRVVNPGGHQHQVVQAVERSAAAAAPMAAPMAARAMRPAGMMPHASYAPSPMPAAPRPAPSGRAGGYAPPAYAAFDHDDSGDGPSEASYEPPELPPQRPRPTEASPMPMPMPMPPPRSPSTSPLDELDEITRELTAARGHGPDVAYLRVVRQRITHWLEALRTLGGHDALIAAVETAVQPLYAALATGTNLDAVLTTLVVELARIVKGGPPAPPRPPSRGAFWK